MQLYRLALATLALILAFCLPSAAQAPQAAGFVVGGGANVLMGGSGRTVALQPLSLQGSLAFNVVLGVSSLKLRPATWR